MKKKKTLSKKYPTSSMVRVNRAVLPREWRRLPRWLSGFLQPDIQQRGPQPRNYDLRRVSLWVHKFQLPVSSFPGRMYGTSGTNIFDVRHWEENLHTTCFNLQDANTIRRMDKTLLQNVFGVMWVAFASSILCHVNGREYVPCYFFADPKGPVMTLQEVQGNWGPEIAIACYPGMAPTWQRDEFSRVTVSYLKKAKKRKEEEEKKAAQEAKEFADKKAEWEADAPARERWAQLKREERRKAVDLQFAENWDLLFRTML